MANAQLERQREIQLNNLKRMNLLLGRQNRDLLEQMRFVFNFQLSSGGTVGNELFLRERDRAEKIVDMLKP